MRHVRHRAAVVLIATIALLANAPAASAAQSATWGWTTDTLVMSFYGGIPYRGCERSSLTVPNSGSAGNIYSSTSTSIVVGLASCSWSSIPTSLNPDTIKTRSQVLRNGGLVSGCSSSVVYNAGGQGSISASTGSSCDKASSADATWTLLGYYGWWDYDDSTWRSESIGLPVITD
jgi:peptidoglycan/LPS O-acetylase OafA/YrhL